MSAEIAIVDLLDENEIEASDIELEAVSEAEGPQPDAPAAVGEAGGALPLATSDVCRVRTGEARDFGCEIDSHGTVARVARAPRAQQAAVALKAPG